MRWTLSLVILAVVAAAADGPTWPRPAPPEGPLGARLQRSLWLATSSTAEHRNLVRVLFYGQSITVQKWSEQVAEALRQRYPFAIWQIENRAIGGFSSQVLVKTAEQDLYPFYPDLMIFHVYGDHRRYEDIIRRTRERTTADILMATDHVTKPEELTESRDRAALTPAQWSAWMNHVFLPDTAERFGCELGAVRDGWKRYLADQQLAPADLLSDSVHLNDHGCFVMAELLKPYLLSPPAAPPADQCVTDIPVAAGDWRDGRLTVEFEGNRVDLIAPPGTVSSASARVLIDGAPPSAHRGCYAATRPTGYPGVGWPCLMKIDLGGQPVDEEWTLRITERDDACERIRFTLAGSVSGADGEGLSTEPFRSASGRVGFEPDDWSMARSREFTRQPPPDGFEIRWRTYLMGTDTYRPPVLAVTYLEPTVTAAQGLANGRHTLELVSERADPPPLAFVRVYRPPLAAQP